jgi:hypothetical protein
MCFFDGVIVVKCVANVVTKHHEIMRQKIRHAFRIYFCQRFPFPFPTNSRRVNLHRGKNLGGWLRYRNLPGWGLCLSGLHYHQESSYGEGSYDEDHEKKELLWRVRLQLAGTDGALHVIGMLLRNILDFSRVRVNMCGFAAVRSGVEVGSYAA